MKKVFAENGLLEKKVGRKQQGKGRHCMMEHPDDPNKCTTVPDYPQIDRGLARDMIKDVGKTVEEYLSHLRHG